MSTANFVPVIPGKMCVSSVSKRCLLFLLLGAVISSQHLVVGTPVHNSQDLNQIETAAGTGTGASLANGEDEWRQPVRVPAAVAVVDINEGADNDDEELGASSVAAAAAQETTNSLHIVNDCVKVSMQEGVYQYMSKGNTGGGTCGLFFITDPDKSIVITINYLDVQCRHGGLISLVDGWELNGQLFPSVEDHEKRLDERFHELCGRKRIYPARFYSSQNAALIQYRIPLFGQGFSVRVQHVVNPRPCNILIQDTEAVYTLQNYGRPVNCSLTTIFPATILPLHLNVGHAERTHRVIPDSGLHRHIYHKCGKMGLQDFVQLGGSGGLDTEAMDVVDEFCGYDPNPGNQRTTILCGMTTVRLVSSGNYQNKVVVAVQKAGIEDLETANYICDL